MPNIKSAKKRVKSNGRKKDENILYASSLKTAIKNVEKAVKANDKEKAQESLKVAIKRLDKANKVGLVKDNKVAREKSRLTKKTNNME